MKSPSRKGFPSWEAILCRGLTAGLLVGLVNVAFFAGRADSAPASSATPSGTPTSAGSSEKPTAAKPAAAPSKAAPSKAASDQANSPTKSKDPIYITSDRLDIYDKEGRAVYSGPSGVVATQGTSKLVGSELTAYYDRQHDNADPAAGGQPQQQQSVSGSQVKRIVVKGPVSVVQNDQVATGDAGDFDRVQNIVTLTGHVSLTQGPNVTTGEKLIYDLNTGVANVFSGPGTPVKSLFVQGSQPGDSKPAKPGSGNSTSSNSTSASGSSAKTAPAKSAPAKPAPAKASQ
jgi:lipopolysaccharide export system protein LptA